MIGSDFSARLLAYLRAELEEPRLEFAEPPSTISGGFDTRIFGFRLVRAPQAFSLFRICSAPPICLTSERTIFMPRPLLPAGLKPAGKPGVILFQMLAGRPPFSC